ncbi:MAG: hypothetical protein CMJ28_01815 [Phycisphaerae bacterium]|nr:hypothetical protein [Phycisphaerae bacterium]
MNLRSTPLLFASLLMMLGACSTTRTGDRLVSMNEAKTLQADEWTSFAQQLRDSMTPTVNRLVGRNQDEAIVLTLGNFVNKTPRREFSDARDVMYNEIRKSLVNTGLVRVSMLGAGGSEDVDTVLAQIKEDMRNDPEFSNESNVDDLGQAKKPEWVLFGEIVSIESREGRRTQYDYAVNLRLLSVRDGASVWEDQIVFTKQFEKGLFGA